MTRLSWNKVLQIIESACGRDESPELVDEVLKEMKLLWAEFGEGLSIAKLKKANLRQVNGRGKV